MLTGAAMDAHNTFDGAEPHAARRLLGGDASGFSTQGPASAAVGGGADPGGRSKVARGPATDSRSVAVDPSKGRLRKSSCTSPRRTVSPSRNSRVPLTCSPLRRVPFLLPRSSSVARGPSTRIRAWCRETLAASRQTAAALSRPIRFSPAVSGSTRSPQTRRGCAPDSVSRRLVRRDARLPAEGVAEPAGRPDETRSSRVVVERLADVVHGLGQRGFGDEDAGPDDVADLGPGERPGAPLDEQAQQLVGLGLERDRPARPKKLPTLLVELEIPETHRHRPRRPRATES